MGQLEQIADRFREVFVDGTWIANTNYQEQLSDLSWREATHKVLQLNSIAALSFHVNYYLAGVIEALAKGVLDIRDKYSFEMTEISSEEAWLSLRDELMSNALKFELIIRALPDDSLDSIFVDAKYGTNRRNLEGIIEHSYYHLGQIVLIKKMIRSKQI